MNTTYEYAGVILNAKMVETFIPKLLKSNELKKREDIIELVREYHISNGGANQPKTSLVSAVKNGLESLRKKGILEKPLEGFYKKIIEDQELERVELNSSKDKELEKKECIYIYYAKKDKLEAQKKEIDSWVCKIIYEKKLTIDKIFRLFSKEYSDQYELAFVLKTEKAEQLTTTILDILKLRGRNSDLFNQGFETSPQELKEIIKFIGAKIETFIEITNE